MATNAVLAAVGGGLLIGLAAVVLMVTTGRIAGVSGFLSRLLPPYTDNQALPRLGFVAGLIAAPPAYSAVMGVAVPIEVTSSFALLVAAGLIVGFASVRGGGCTSGHGICGTARLSPRSLVATAVFMTTGIATVFVLRHVMGG